MDSVFGLVVKRIGLGILTLFAISIIFFMGVEALPGDLAEEILGQNALPETVQPFARSSNSICRRTSVILPGSAT